MLAVILYIAFGVTSVLTWMIFRQLASTLASSAPPKQLSKLGTDVDLPSVTVCIPARNEQHALTDCLQNVLDSTYQKLETIVLDDVSLDNTPALIKSFASQGVRFVKGKALPNGWIGKNHALQGLLNEASGTYILFMDVDTRVSADAIENTVRYAIANRLTMVSVLPRRQDGWRASVVFSPLRYFWELVFNRPSSPAVASNIWLIRRHTLENDFNGFNDLKHAIQPEAVLAQQLNAKKAYSFLVSTAEFGVRFEKKWRSQLLTSVRLLYPLLNKNPLLASMALLDVLLIFLPFAVVTSLLFTPFALVHVFAIILCSTLMTIYAMYCRSVWAKGWVVGAFLLPVILLQDVMLIIASMVLYSRRKVTWKGRVVSTR